MPIGIIFDSNDDNNIGVYGDNNDNDDDDEKMITMKTTMTVTMMPSRQSWAEARRRNWFRSQEGR